MKKSWLIAIVPLLVGAGCLISFNLIGSEVAPDGTLIEPFWMLPVGYLFVAIGLVAGLTMLLRRLLKKM
jgi:hypothetical protein